MKKKILKSVRRILIAVFFIILPVFLFYIIWQPGKTVTDGRHDLKSNAIWLSHAWLADDGWFNRASSSKAKSYYHNPDNIIRLANDLSELNIKYAFFHLCPADGAGIPKTNEKQTERLLDIFEEKGIDVLVWVGGVKDVHCMVSSSSWRKRFINSIQQLFDRHPKFSGLHLNVEPMPDDNQDFLRLLDELNSALDGKNKILSVAAYPPPTIWHDFPEVHWSEGYHEKIASKADQIVVMMYDSSIIYQKIYQNTISLWTKEVLSWSDKTPILLGVPVYDDGGTGYHNPDVENIENSLKGIHAALADYEVLPKNYSGIAIYCNWEFDDKERKYYKKHFMAKD